ncbi:LysR family transcriptional regulator [Phyllobacterium sp. 0TCS1.6C]|uniref:LysR family transcriptional regulator n=1 Tax=unclassified Phyllobacterium TaxID=2638441 RepID=UPI00226417F2|nr:MULTISPECIES: LysR family transcriptional regulator [unclassified Phyllobacterium]MCX8281962.1 LysR family transcriptional regulator [Phyllobacterium sp. 0TCS1.6C]MCX8294425.1 LysR family transcriptional regulator [Phyllobacterium sp. 0TCS1.6A]
MQPNPTLDQLNVFAAIADAGSFSAAARRLNRSQSVISYAIANLEAQLELKLFERSGTREPRLTEAGRALLEDARRMALALQNLRSRVQGLKEGIEANIAVAVDVNIPTPVLASVLRTFETRFPTVGLRLHVGALGTIWDLALKRQVDFAVGGPPVTPFDELVTVRLGQTSMLPVAAPDHPLALYPGRVPLSVMREHVQLVVTDLSEQTKGMDFGVYAYRIWRLTDVATKRELMLAGLGWGGLPKWMVRDDMAAGRLVPLDLEPYPETAYSIFALHLVDRPLGPASGWLVDAFRSELDTFE